MSAISEEQYFTFRERQSREMAAKASDVQARAAHLELASLYARRAAEKRFANFLLLQAARQDFVGS